MKICTSVVNNPYFICIQYITLKKYVKGKYEFIIFNDAKDFPDNTNNNDITIRKKITDLCTELNIQCIQVPNDFHQDIYTFHYSQRCSSTMNFMMKYFEQNPDQYLVIDSDMFCINDFDIHRYQDYDSAIVLQSRHNDTIHYMWNGLFYFDMFKIKNFDKINWDCHNELCLDTGGMTKDWLKYQNNNEQFPSVNDLRQFYHKETNYNKNGIYFIKHLWSCTWNDNEIPDCLKKNKELYHYVKNDVRNVIENNETQYFCEIYDDIFFHYRAGGNWRGEGTNFHINNSKKLLKIMYNNC